MGKLEEELTQEQMLDYAKKDLVISEHAYWGGSGSLADHTFDLGYCNDGIVMSGGATTSTYNMAANFPTIIARYANDLSRRIGYISGVNSDGSFRLRILGTGNFNPVPLKYVSTNIHFQMSGSLVLKPPSTDHYLPEGEGMGTYQWQGSTSGNFINAYADANGGTNNIMTITSYDYMPEWGDNPSGRAITASIANCAYQNDVRIGESTVQLTNDETTTLELGNPMNGLFWQKSLGNFYFGDKDIGGNLFGLMSIITNVVTGATQDLPTGTVFTTLGTSGPGGQIDLPLIASYQPFQGQMAYHYTPYNLLLTYDLQAAKQYIQDGTLPDDVFLYPFDTDHIPVNSTGNATPEDSDGTVGDPEGEGEITGDGRLEPTELLTPGETPQSLTNNNLYWLTSQQLKSFLDWFWEDATDIASANDLWDKITGAYENLSQAIVAVRYMPVDSTWIGGVAIDPSIKVGMLEKEEQVQAILKAKAPIRDIGKTKVERLKKSLGWWINYTPYAQAYLYLPFFGYLDLDINLIMNKELAIRAVYDILSGTIQYFIFVGGYDYEGGTMINTVCAKMATDIPISLQTKTERDSAIFSNVSGVAATLIGGGVSAAAGNPIGMVMSTANLAATQPQGAPMSLKGNISESGAFYDCGKPVIYIKRPQVNIPNGYPSHIGYPCNAYRTVGSMRGFFKCENPYIHYKSGSDRAKPTYEEMEEIYNALSNGVYMLDN